MLESLAKHRDESLRALSDVNLEQVALFCDELLAVRSREALVVVIGNGGSAATASHMANDLMFGSGLSSPPLRVISLSDNACAITATGNDLDFDQIFSRQITALCSGSDLLVCITASGNSRNIILGIESARSLGMRTVAMTGFDGGEVSSMVDVCVHVQSRQGAYGPVEDAHLAVNHIVTSFLQEQAIQTGSSPAEGCR